MQLRALLLLASVAAFSPASQPGRFPRRAIVSSSIREADLEDLITLALSQPEAAARDSLVAGAVRSWAPAERAELSNAVRRLRRASISSVKLCSALKRCSGVFPSFAKTTLGIKSGCVKSWSCGYPKSPSYQGTGARQCIG